jgi:hypothetical protein
MDAERSVHVPVHGGQDALLGLPRAHRADHDVKLFYRYVLGSEEGHRDGVLPTSPAWPVVERRRIPFGRRWSDKKGTP